MKFETDGSIPRRDSMLILWLLLPKLAKTEGGGRVHPGCYLWFLFFLES